MQRPSSGSIYDLGYRPYDGARKGRAYAIMSLYWYSLRSIFGIGRSTVAKAFPIALAVFAIVPAIIQIAIAAVAPADFTLVAAENHFRYVQVIIALFCAVSAPEILGRDQRARTLSLYFSRAISRADYVTAKLAALFVALFLVTLLPQSLLLLGKAVAENDVLGYLGDNAGDIPPILASCVAISLVMASVSLAIAAQSPNRAISTIAVLGSIIISFTLGNIVTGTLDGGLGDYGLLIGPMAALDGLTYWFFNAAPEPNSNLERAGLDGYVYFVACMAFVTVSLAFLYRRFARLGA